MEVFILTFIIMGLLIAAMAVGVIMGRGPVKGSCGGMAAVGLDGACDICGGDMSKCEEENDKVTKAASKNTADLSYDATKK